MKNMWYLLSKVEFGIESIKTFPAVQQRRIVMIKIENLSNAYEMKNIFKGLSITLYDTQIYALVGINGIGKTTFLNSITQPTFRTAGNEYEY